MKQVNSWYHKCTPLLPFASLPSFQFFLATKHMNFVFGMVHVSDIVRQVEFMFLPGYLFANPVHIFMISLVAVANTTIFQLYSKTIVLIRAKKKW